MKRLFLAICILSLFGCNSKKAEKKYRVGFSQCLMSDDWRRSMYSEVQRELLFQEDMELLFRNANGDSQMQVAQIEELVDEGVDILIVSPNEAEPFKEIIERIYKSGVPIILVDRHINTEHYTAFVGGNNKLIGREAATYISGHLGGKGRIIEAYESLSTTPFFDRNTGFRERLTKYPEMQLDTVRALGPGAEKFAQLLKNGDYDAVYAHTDVAAQYAYQIAKDLEKHKDMFFIGIDGLATKGGGLEMVENGILKASFLYPTGGDVAIQIASDILHNRPFKKENNLPTIVIDSTNVSIMRVQANKLLDQQQDINRMAGKIGELTSVFQSQRILIYLMTGAVVLAIILTAFVFQSLVEKKRINKELQFKNEKIIEFSKKAEEATQAKFRFFTNISHEFRTPLTLMLGPIQELLETTKDRSQKKDLNFVYKNAQRLLRLINQLMDYRKVENSKMDVKASEQNIIDFLKDIMSSFEKAAKGRKIDFKLVSETPNVKVWFDGQMLDKVFFNILSNAFKFTSDLGFIHVKVQLDGIHNLVKIIFEDNGRGMTEEQVEHAFERFYQGETHSRVEGTGLGLALSKELIKLHKGNVSLKSQLDKGTRFEVSLLLGNEHFEAASIVETQEEELLPDKKFVLEAEEVVIQENEPFQTKDLSLLLIEDSQDLREFLNSKLSQNYQIIEAEDGETGLLKATQFIPDLVICDLMLPKKNGHQVLKELKSDLRTSHIPFILLTARGDINEKVLGIQEGADDYITKPFNFRYLAERIRMILLNREKLRDHYLHQAPVENVSSASGNLDKKFVNDFMAVVEENFSNAKFGVSEITEKLGLSRMQLYRKVKALMGYSVNDYINLVRLKKASHLIKEGQSSISEIAYTVGYSSPAYFSTAFKSHFGVSPKEYRTA